MINRSAGILLPVSSLPSEYGIGCFDESAYKFVDWLKTAGQSWWQILPLGPAGYGDSPYQSFSSFAGNPYFISLSEFVKKGYLTKEDCLLADMGDNPSAVDYQKLYKNRRTLLKKAYKNSGNADKEEIEKFTQENDWVEDYALFMALKDKFKDKPLIDWDEKIRLRDKKTIEKYEKELCDEVGFYKFLQYHFFAQWHKLKEYANRMGIGIIGDIPIYVALDSVDVWKNPSLFQLNQKGIPVSVAGCPPDSFSEKGQLWGNPLYNWDNHKKTGYKWWVERLRACFEMYDAVRIDHFRGFDEYYSIPYGSKDAAKGSWEKGPGMELFAAVENAIGKRDVLAEDLGFVTESVKKLVKDSGFPNMKVLEFAFDSRDTGNKNDYLPHNYKENSVAYTGTHDNQTLVSWFKEISPSERAEARKYLCDSYTPDKELNKSFISLIMRSSAKLCVVPMQDWLGLDDKSRMNTPSTVGNNWCWRVKKSQLTEELSTEIMAITSRYGRAEKSV